MYSWSRWHGRNIRAVCIRVKPTDKNRKLMEDELIRGKAEDGGDKVKARRETSNTLPVCYGNLLFLYGGQGVQYLFY